MSLEVELSLCLPTDELSVPVVRHICSFSLGEVGVDESCVNDITLALSEACTNVLDHVDEGEAYEVFISIDEERCVIRVKDAGDGFDADAERPLSDGSAESGRGLEMIKALVDELKFESKPEQGMIVRLEKALEFDEDHPVRQRLHDVDA